MSTFAIVLDGVIRKNDNGVINSGQRLYNALCSVGRVAVLCGPDKDKADWFLKTNGFKDHAFLLAEDVDQNSTPERRRMAQISWLRNQEGTAVDFAVEPNPEIAAYLIRNGVPTLIAVHPQFSHPSFLPDYKSVAVPWHELTAEIAYQEEQKAKKTWTESD